MSSEAVIEAGANPRGGERVNARLGNGSQGGGKCETGDDGGQRHIRESGGWVGWGRVGLSGSLRSLTSSTPSILSTAHPRANKLVVSRTGGTWNKEGLNVSTGDVSLRTPGYV